MFLFIQSYLMCLVPCIGEMVRDSAGSNMAKYGIGQGIVWMRNMMYLSSLGFLVGMYFDSVIMTAIAGSLVWLAGYRLLDGARYVRNNLSYVEDKPTVDNKPSQFNVTDVYELSKEDKKFLTTFVENILVGGKKGPIVILYGSGTNGKSTLAREICKFVEEKRKTYCVGNLFDCEVSHLEKMRLVRIQDPPNLSDMLPIMRGIDTNFIVETEDPSSIRQLVNYNIHFILMPHVFES